MNVYAIDHLVINVRDVERSCRWYEQVLGMERLNYGKSPDRPRTAMLFGQQRINLRPVDVASTEWGTASHAAAGTADLCFLTRLSPDEVVTHLGTCMVDVTEGPTHRDGARGSMTSVYCRGPDGNLIEISSYG
ncbi:VOC family protein [Agrobacterium larrymoorei]|uniref:Catechol 2,3-dioxygenase-like lactoylglutathione lyase family enzyme n=1 Tax=Agrobacterium larrymoorei TaxID=160699 RepID=A0ABU0UQ33_9HYPH|nr:VOC family protein [Agrobacterium larrymoorei]MDQ1187059.1 catechol 2,3-dioxygenase-like lactoylglutathione lyase family enzyme [Agrobacterium larrymoorei]